MTTDATQQRTTAHHNDILDTLQVAKVTDRASTGGRWVVGTIAGHDFQALVFPEHAERESYELADSRISKLWVCRRADNATLSNFDRGWDIKPATDTAKAIVDALAAGLAEHIFGR